MDNRFFKRVDILIKESGIKKTDLYNAFGVKSKTKFEDIFSPVSDNIQELERLCDELGISIRDFFSDDIYLPAPKDKLFKETYSDYFHDKYVDRVFEVVGYDHAGEILDCYAPIKNSLLNVLKGIKLTMNDVKADGGNESQIPKKFRKLFINEGWTAERQITGDLIVDVMQNRTTKISYSIEGFLAGYKMDFLKDRIAVDVEWNSKDQTFDRDLVAMRSYYDAGIIALGIIITRGTELEVFPKHYGFKKFGASTTWMGKLTERLDSRRAGGCPIIAIGIKPDAISGYKSDT